MPKKRLLWQLYPSYLLITLASLLAVGWFTTYSLQEIFSDTIRQNLQQQLQLIDEMIGPQFDPAARERYETICGNFRHATGARVTLVDRQGKVICDTDTAESLESHDDRPEIRTALSGEIGGSTRFSRTLQQDMLYVAVPLVREGRVVGAVRAAVPLTSIAHNVHSFQATVATGGLVIAAFAAVVSLFVARRISRPLEQMRFGAERFARGELGYKLAVPESEEMAGLAEALNLMARQLEERIRTIVQHKNEQEAVLASMAEGVFAVDTEFRMISINKAATALLANTRPKATGRSLQEVVRNADLQRFVSHALISTLPIEGDIIMRGEPDRVLQAHGTALRDAQHRGIGAVIVLNDVTRFRQLEEMRRDFVANVSHELKTPITSIKGFIETLLDGAMENREDAERFLRIVGKQAERLNTIIEDLLRLSKIEKSEEAADIVLEPSHVRQVLEAAAQDCQGMAVERQVTINLACDPAIEARINAPLLEQAIVNLLDNAIKYSESGGQVRLSAAHQDGDLVIIVKDDGCGIPAEHLPRIFERFYRVDKGRSRKLGGTGLGLSIVKHIVNVHHGRVLVESMPGRGSVFTIRLPS